MPRKPKQKNQEKMKTTVVVNGVAIVVTLYPPKPARGSWYAYWPGLVAAKSTRQRTSAEAIQAVVAMLANNGKLGHADDLVLSDDALMEIQRRHFAKKIDPAARVRAEKSLENCLEAIRAFQAITGVEPVAGATADDCERFQQKALTLPKDWVRKRDLASQAKPYSSHTVIKWSRELHAAFERANKHAGKKCVRGVVEDSRLLTQNPWSQFTWIEGTTPKKRQFDDGELIRLLDFLDATWPGVTVAAALAKTLLWSWGRKEEIVGLKWTSCRIVADEIHFETVGKWGVEKWFRIPQALYEELVRFRTESPFVFAAYNQQVREFHTRCHRPTDAALVTGEFSIVNFARWFDRRLAKWSKTLPKGRATMHVFRKTSLQYARTGADINLQVASDARVGAAVMMRHYVMESDPERRATGRSFASRRASLQKQPAAAGTKLPSRIRRHWSSKSPWPCSSGTGREWPKSPPH